MSRTRSYTKESIAVIVRFFAAIDAIIAENKIRGLNTYSNMYKIPRRAMQEQQRNIGSGRFQVSWIIPLVTDFGISAEWLLTGRGKMYANTHDQQNAE